MVQLKCSGSSCKGILESCLYHFIKILFLIDFHDVKNRITVGGNCDCNIMTFDILKIQQFSNYFIGYSIYFQCFSLDMQINILSRIYDMF